MWLTRSYQSGTQAIVFARGWFSRAAGTDVDRDGTGRNGENRHETRS